MKIIYEWGAADIKPGVVVKSAPWNGTLQSESFEHISGTVVRMYDPTYDLGARKQAGPVMFILVHGDWAATGAMTAEDMAKLLNERQCTL